MSPIMHTYRNEHTGCESKIIQGLFQDERQNFNYMVIYSVECGSIGTVLVEDFYDAIDQARSLIDLDGTNWTQANWGEESSFYAGLG